MSTTFGAWVRERRLTAGLRQRDLARLVGVQDPSTVTYWEKGTNEPWDDGLVRLADHFDVPVIELACLTDRFASERSPVVLARWAKGLTRAEAARRLRIDVGTLRSWELGIIPRDRNAEKLFLFLGVQSEITRPRAPMPYYGTKSRHIQRLLPLVSGPRYVEPFGGSGVLLLSKPQASHEVYNDIDDRMAGIFRVLRDPVGSQELKRRLEATPFARSSYDEALDIVDDESRSEVDRAWAQFVLLAQSFNARPVVGNWNASAGPRKIQGWWRRVAFVDGWHERLSSVLIENADAFDVMERHDRHDTVFYLDPPYESKRSPWRSYRHDLPDHSELIEFVSALRGRVVIAGYDSHNYTQLDATGDWRRIDLTDLERIWVKTEGSAA